MTILEYLKSERTVEESQARKIVFYICFFIYVCINLFFLLRHEPYRDEANVWLMAKYLSPSQLLKEIHFQGHPCLWYFVVMPFAKMGLPYRTIEVISLLIMCIASFIFMDRAKLIGLAKIVCLFSPIMLYFYPVIARGYCLIILLLVLIACTYPKRYDKPLTYGLLLGLLVQADTIAIGIAGGLAIAWLVESAYLHYTRKRSKNYLKIATTGLWMPLVSLLFWILQMKDQFGQTEGHAVGFDMASFGSDCRDYAYYITERMTGWSRGFIFLFFLILLLTALATSVCNRNYVALFVFLFEYAFQTIFSVIVYELHIWHFISLSFLFFWMVWILQVDSEKKTKNDDSMISDIRKGTLLVGRYVMNVLVIIFAFATFAHWNSEAEPSNLQVALHGTYSNAGEAAAFIEQNIESDSLIVSTNVAADGSIFAYLDGYSFRNAATGEECTHAIYAEDDLLSSNLSKIEEWIREKYPNQRDYYLIVSGASYLEGEENLPEDNLIYQSKVASAKGEDYRIYIMTIGDK